MKYPFTSRLNDLPQVMLSTFRTERQYYGENMISFAEKWFARDCYSAEGLTTAITRASQQRLDQQRVSASEGDPDVRMAILGMLLRGRSHSIKVEQTMITSGTKHSLELLAQAMLQPGDAVCAANPIHSDIWHMVNMHGAQLIMVQSDEHGIVPEDLEVKLKKHRPKFLYVDPSSHKVTNHIWNMERKKSLIQLCSTYNTLIIEEDPYGELQLDTDQNPRMIELERAAVDRIVVYISSFGKGVFPGIQLGIVVGDERVIEKLVQVKQISGAYSSLWEQLILKEMLNLRDETVDRQLHEMVKQSQACMNLMEDHLHREKVWQATSGIRAPGGMYYRIGLPDELPIQSVLACSLRKQTSFVPEIYIDQSSSTPSYKQLMRLSCTISDPEQIHQGMERLGEAIGEFMGRYSG